MPKEYMVDRMLPNIHNTLTDGKFNINLITDDLDSPFFVGDNIQDWIWMLNDRRFKYKQIAEFITATFG